jgi:uncharacterized protein YdhG (YjbR/CyaY superfamily)
VRARRSVKRRGAETSGREALAPPPMPITTHDAYFDTVADDIVRARLESIQAEVDRLLPGMTKCIGYKIPAFRDGRIFFYFAAFKKHIGIFPPVSQDVALVHELKRYRGPKGNLTFVHAEPLPLELIGRVAVALHREHGVQR